MKLSHKEIKTHLALVDNSGTDNTVLALALELARNIDPDYEWGEVHIDHKEKAAIVEAIEVAQGYPTVERLLWLVESANLLAKIESPAWYGVKRGLVEMVYDLDPAAITKDKQSWGYDCYSLYHKAVGVISIHDPHGELSHLDVGASAFTWSGVRRQSWALQSLMCDRTKKAVAYLSAPHKQCTRADEIIARFA
ncbi:hypothetical protein [Shewanella aestuarii]|uniref:Uncharacterized protein n=1 Tax=Shewanella aestuarii TaxID=1028752 RepID=A0A6G9QRI4_9GAMM|nr:hypothetical protein [Shewanella aestuarii]QIR16637.1 hypothetical protein HBH39_19365 [Shewanella aestuarii]